MCNQWFCSITPTPADTIVRVDRSVSPIYPDWVREVMHPKLERTGPAVYGLATVELLFWNGQMGGDWREQDVYENLISENMIEGCLGLSDGLAIQQMGVIVFPKLLAGKVMFLWKSVVRDNRGFLVVPYIVGNNDGVYISWHRLAIECQNYPAARFAS